MLCPELRVRYTDVSLNELIGRLRCWDPWAHDEENPDHYMIARGVEAASWMAGRAHDYPEQFAAGLKPYAVTDKYYFARRPEITRIVDVSRQIDKKVDCNRANEPRGPPATLAPACAPISRGRARNSPCSGTTMSPRTATTSSKISGQLSALQACRPRPQKLTAESSVTQK